VITEWAQITRWLSKRQNIPMVGEEHDWTVRLVADPFDGKYVIPLGVSETPFHVEVKDGRVIIGEKA
jgi:hypothetical protein